MGIVREGPLEFLIADRGYGIYRGGVNGSQGSHAGLRDPVDEPAEPDRACSGVVIKTQKLYVFTMQIIDVLFICMD